MTSENLQGVIQALRNASVLVASHVDGAEHAFAVRQLQLSIALMLNELDGEKRIRSGESDVPQPRVPQRIPPRAEGLRTLGSRYKPQRIAEA